MAPFEILGRGNQNNQTTQFLDIMMRNRSRQDALAQARKELEVQQQEAQLERVARKAEIEFRQSEAGKREQALEQFKADEQTRTLVRAQVRGAKTTQQFENLQGLGSKWLTEEEMKSYGAAAATRERNARDLMARNKGFQEGALSRDIEQKMLLPDQAGGYAQQPSQQVLATQAGQVAAAVEANKVEAQKVDVAREKLGIDKENNTLLAKQIEAQFSAAVIQSQGNLRQTIFRNVGQLLSKPLDPGLSEEAALKERAMSLAMLSSLGQQMINDSSVALAQSGGNMVALGQQSPLMAGVVESTKSTNGNMGAILDDLINEHIAFLNKEGKKKEADDAKKVRNHWRSATGGYKTPGLIGGLSRFGKKWIVDPNLVEEYSKYKTDDEAALFIKWLIGANPDSNLSISNPIPKNPSESNPDITKGYIPRNIPFKDLERKFSGPPLPPPMTLSDYREPLPFPLKSSRGKRK